ncbi:hypothetical protein B0T24DRAFT_681371 [Lasiosphaeria ovina]|uniref:Uncharacterized protein n=1 Tax=Lasiosphaeria ovina TaxID=92902 RepID=A0AAE0K4S3_9PEZI|nr:hypothetical protein B0T24DRAFT_681371 [Lasiosphaeria ovina]
MSHAEFDTFRRLDVGTARPLLAHFHGGGLITGTALDSQMIPLWLLQFAESRGAIVASPCLRLLPEALGSEILDDIKDFWGFVFTTLNSIVAQTYGISVDLGRVAAGGGRHCAFDLDSFAFSPRPLYVPEAASASISEYLSNIKPGTFRVSSPSPEYRGLFQAAFNTGRYRDLLRGDRHMRIREALRKAKDVPPIWIAQGVNDRITSQEAASELVQEIRAAHPDTPLLYSLQPSGHGFDVSHGMTEAWVQEGLRFTEQHW